MQKPTLKHFHVCIHTSLEAERGEWSFYRPGLRHLKENCSMWRSTWKSQFQGLKTQFLSAPLPFPLVSGGWGREWGNTGFRTTRLGSNLPLTIHVWVLWEYFFSCTMEMTIFLFWTVDYWMIMWDKEKLQKWGDHIYWDGKELSPGQGVHLDGQEEFIRQKEGRFSRRCTIIKAYLHWWLVWLA